MEEPQLKLGVLVSTTIDLSPWRLGRSSKKKEPEGSKNFSSFMKFTPMLFQ